LERYSHVVRFNPMTIVEYLQWQANLCRRIAVRCIDLTTSNTLQQMAELHERQADMESQRESQEAAQNPPTRSPRH